MFESYLSFLFLFNHNCIVMNQMMKKKNCFNQWHSTILTNFTFNKCVWSLNSLFCSEYIEVKEKYLNDIDWSLCLFLSLTPCLTDYP